MDTAVRASTDQAGALHLRTPVSALPDGKLDVARLRLPSAASPLDCPGDHRPWTRRPGRRRGARWASRLTGRGAGAMIGGLVAMTLDRSILGQLGQDRRSVVVTGTNGKSTTTRMTAAALGTLGPVATNAEGANMDAGLIAALAAARDAR